MNSCVDLLSPPAWWCGLKSCMQQTCPHTLEVTTCVVVWIEIFNPPVTAEIARSPPAWWCGLKYVTSLQIKSSQIVTTCVVVWIEILTVASMQGYARVTTCVVVWIEIA